MQDNGAAANHHALIETDRLHRAPLNSLPPLLQGPRAKLDKLALAQADADRELESARQAHAQYLELTNVVASLRADVEIGESEVERTQVAIGDYLKHLRDWPRIAQLTPRGQVAFLLNSLVQSERFAEFLPPWILSRKSKLTQASKVLADFARANHIKPE
jgi:hypothetical protein